MVVVLRILMMGRCMIWILRMKVGRSISSFCRGRRGGETVGAVMIICVCIGFSRSKGRARRSSRGIVCRIAYRCP